MFIEYHSVLLLQLFQIDSSDISSKIKSCLTQYHTSHDIAQIERVKIDKFERELSIKLNVYRKVQESVSHQLNKVRSLQHFVDYLKIVKDIQDIGYGPFVNIVDIQTQRTFYSIDIDSMQESVAIEFQKQRRP